MGMNMTDVVCSKNTLAGLFSHRSALLLLGGALLLALFVLSAGVAEAEVYVDDNACPGPGTGTSGDPFCSIQTAIDAEPAGGTVHIRQGTYAETLTLGKNLYIRGASSTNTTLNAGSSYGINVNSSIAGTVTIEGLNFIGYTEAGLYGGAVNQLNMDLDLNDLVFYPDNASSYAVYFNGRLKSMDANGLNIDMPSNYNTAYAMYFFDIDDHATINDAYIARHRGAIFFDSVSVSPNYFTVTNTIITNNRGIGSSPYAYAIWANCLSNSAGTVTIQNVDIYDNDVEYYFHGISITAGTVNMNDVLIDKNDIGAPLRVDTVGDFAPVNVRSTNNSYANSHGMHILNAASVTIDGSDGTLIQDNGGAGLRLDAVDSTTIHDIMISGHTGTYGVYLTGGCGNLTLYDVILSDNENYAIYIHNAMTGKMMLERVNITAHNSGIYTTVPNSDLDIVINDATFYGLGNPIYIADPLNSVEMDNVIFDAPGVGGGGTAAYFTHINDHAIINNTYITKHTSGIHLSLNLPQTYVKITNTTITNNRVFFGGTAYGIYVSSHALDENTVTIENVDIFDNYNMMSSDYFHGIQVSGGTVNMKNVLIDNNTGRPIWVSTAGDFVPVNVRSTNNNPTIVDTPGMAIAYAASVTIDGSDGTTISGNGGNGLHLHDALGVTVSNLNLLSNGAAGSGAGIYLAGTSQAWISSSVIDNHPYSVWARNTAEVWLYNSTITNSAIDSYYATDSSHIWNVNTAYDGNVSVLLSANFTLQWYVNARVVDSLATNNPVNGAMVYFNRSADGVEFINVVTTTDGWVNWTTITEYYRDEDGLTTCSPYDITATNLLNSRLLPNEAIQNFREIIIPLSNEPPVITTTSPPASVDEGSSYSYDFDATDLNPVDTLVWAFGNFHNATGWLTLNPTSGLLSGTPSSADVGWYFVNVTVSDGNGGVDYHSFILEVVDVNGAPVITTADVTTAPEDALYYVDYDATDPENDTLAWNLEGTVTSWLGIDNVTGIVSGNPDNADVGVYEAWVNVTDGNGGSDSHHFAVTVTNANPSITTTSPPATIAEDSFYAYDFNSTDDGEGTITWSLQGNIVSWLGINTATGLVTSIPTNAYVGFYEAWVNVTDGNGGSDSHYFTVTVTNVNPIITSTSPPTTVAKDSFYAYNFNSTDDGQGTITWHLYVEAVWLTIDNNTGVVSGVPDNSHVGDHNINVWVTDGNGGSDLHFFVVTVTDVNGAPSITTADVTTATEDAFYNVDYDATDPDNDTLTWSLVTDCDFLSINSSTGVLSGTPDNSDVGSWSVSVTVDDGNGGSDQQAFTLTVSNTPPQVTGSPVTTISQDEFYQEDFDSSDGNLGTSAWLNETVDSGGNVGYFNSLALDGSGNAHISYSGSGDLKYAYWTGSAWNITTVDSGGNVGRFNSLALDSSGNAHISYCDYYDLKYAYWTGSSWNITLVDNFGSIGDTSLALDGSGNAHISYHEYGNHDLKYAHWTGSAWNITTVDDAGWWGGYTSIALDDSENPHISYLDNNPNYDLKHAFWTGSAWSITTVDSDGEVGGFTSLALDDSGYAHISYVDKTNDALKYAYWTGSAWSNETVDSVGSWGGYTSLALDGSGNACISYYDYATESVKYAEWTGSSWSITTVGSGGSWGGNTSLALDDSGNPHISYWDGTNQDLKYAYQVDNAWSIEGNVTTAGFLTIDSYGVVRGTPNNMDVGWYNVNVRATDDNGGVGWYNYTLNVANVLPLINTPPTTTALEGTLYSFDFGSTDDGNGTTTQWNILTTNASWLSIESNTGVLSGTPGSSDVGYFTVEVQVYDLKGGYDTYNFILTVLDSNGPPTITTPDVTTATEDTPYNVDYDATDPDNDTLTWSLVTDCDFLSINSSTGILSGTPDNTDVGVWSVNVTVDDGNGGSDWSSFTLVVTGLGPVHNIDSGEYFTSIQAAIDAASPGDTLSINPGTYGQNLNINKDITFAGSSFTLQGDITVTGSGALHMDSVTIDVGTVSVNSGGLLSVDNSPDTIISENVWVDGVMYINSSTWKMNNTANGTYNIQVNGTGMMIIQDTGTGPSTIMANNPSYRYLFTVKDGATFRLENSTVRDAGWQAGKYGLEIYADGAFFYNAILTDNYCGIYFQGSSSSKVLFSNISSNDNWGIGLWSSSSNTISNNTISSNGMGIYLDGSSANTIYGNMISFNSEYGIADPDILGGQWNLIYHNNFIGNTIQAHNDNNPNIWNETYPLGGNYWDDYNTIGEGCNDINADGFCDAPYDAIAGGNGAQDNWPHTVQDGWLNAHPAQNVKNVNQGLWYETIQGAIDAATNGDTIEVGAGTYFENVVVNKQLTITGAGQDVTIIDGGGVGDVVYVSADWVNITGFTVTNSGSTYQADAGIQLDNIENCNIENNNVSSNGEIGIWVYYSSNIIVNNNTVWNNVFGIYLYHSDSNNVITSNTANSNTAHGIILSFSSYNTIADNTISNNSYGIFLYSSNNTIVNNTISNNNNYGIYLESLSYNDNLIYHNNFINNNGGGVQAEDAGSNFWDNGYPSGGNYWGDYAGVDNFNGVNQDIPGFDGIGDTPHSFTGDQDDYPLMQPFDATNTPPAITTGDITTATEDLPYSVDYEASDPDNDTLTWSLVTDCDFLFINSSTGVLSGTPDNSDVGFWTVNVTVDDGNGGSDLHSFTLTVTNNLPTILTADITTATEGFPYSNDYDSDDDGQGTITWSLETNGTWLSIDSATGVLSGTPASADIGWHWVNVAVDDGNGGTDYHNFTLTVNRVRVHNYARGMNYTNIQDAIDAVWANGWAGDTINVDKGTHYENIVINITLSLIGEDRDTTIIEGCGIGDVIYVTADGVNITGFTVTGSGDHISPNRDAGIDIKGKNSHISNNIVLDNTYGIVLTKFSDYNTIVSNSVSDNYYGIYLEDSNDGNIIANNTVSWNYYHGIWGMTCNNNQIYNNNIINNSMKYSYNYYGIYLHNCNGNLLHHNNIIDNRYQARDNGNNQWDNGYPSGGNYWSDYTGVDLNSTPSQNVPPPDSIGDSPYVDIDGGAGAHDNYPLMLPFDATNTPPAITMGDITTATEDLPYSVDYEASDPDNDTLTWSLVTDCDFLFINSSTGVLSGTPDNSDVGSCSVTVTVNDGNGGSDWSNFMLTVLDSNGPPSITTPDVTTATEDALYSVDYEATDPNNDTLTWSLVTDCDFLAIDANSGFLSGTPDNSDVSSWTVNVTVDDGNGGTDWQSFTLVVSNTPPGITTVDDTTATEDIVYSNSYDSTDDAQGTITWGWGSSHDAGAWLVLDTATGIVFGMPNNAAVGSCTVNLTVNDGNGGMDWHEFTLTISNVNPAITTTSPPASVNEGSPYSYDFNSNDDGQGTIAWSLVTNADFLIIDANTGVLSGTPDNSDVGAWNVNVTVDDGNGGTDAHSFTLTVAPNPVHNYARNTSYSTIQAAIDDAQANGWAGDTLEIDNMVFDESLTFTIDMSIIDSTFTTTGFISIAPSATLTIDNVHLETGSITIGGTLNLENSPTTIISNDVWVNGTLYINSSTWELDSSFNGEFGIQVNSTGKMVIQDTGPGQSIIRSHTTFAYGFRVLAGAAFSLEDSMVRDAGWNNSNPGLIIFSDSAIIYGATITENYWGITFDGSSNSVVENCNISFNDYRGLTLQATSDNNTITNNTVSDNNWYGIRLDGSSTNTINVNTVTHNSDGISIREYSTYNTLTGNSVSYNSDGIFIYDESNFNTLTSNDVLYNSDEGITMDYTSNNSLISNVVWNNYNGIHLYYSSDSILTSNNVSYNSNIGIYLEYISSSNTLTGNDVYNNDYGIYLYDGSSSNTLTSNTASSNTHGIHVFDTSNFNTLTSNVASANSNYGIYIEYSSNNHLTSNFIQNNLYGIYLYDSSNFNTLTSNTASYNTRGIYLEFSSNFNTLVGNTVSYNSNYGIGLTSSSNNLIYHNNIIGNTFQAYDDGSTNRWNETYPTSGNYWSNYMDVDNNHGPAQNLPGPDSIGDTPYATISGGVAQDYYPLWNLFNPINNPPAIVTLDESTATEDVLYSIDYDAIDIDGDSLTWSLATDAGFLAINNGTGVLSGTPNNTDLGVWTVSVTVDDGNGGTDVHGFFLTVSSGPQTVDWIDILDIPGIGNGSIPDQIVSTGFGITGYAAAYNSTSGYIGEVSVNWTVSNTDGASASTSDGGGSSDTFNAGLTSGTAYWTAYYAPGINDTIVFDITSSPTVDWIDIVDSSGMGMNSISDQEVSAGFSINGYAAAFNAAGDYIGDVSVTWTVVNDGGATASTSDGVGDSDTFDAGTTEGTAYWNAYYGNISDSVTFTISSSESPYTIGLPDVEVSSPNGGEDWMKNDTYPIVWHTTGNFEGSCVDIYWSIDGGTTWVLISANETDDGAYLWLVPDFEIDYALIRVMATDVYGTVAYDTSDTGFAIDPPPVLIPSGGQEPDGEDQPDTPVPQDRTGASDPLPVQLSLLNLMLIELLVIGLLLAKRRRE